MILMFYLIVCICVLAHQTHPRRLQQNYKSTLTDFYQTDFNMPLSVNAEDY